MSWCECTYTLVITLTKRNRSHSCFQTRIVVNRNKRFSGVDKTYSTKLSRFWNQTYSKPNETNSNLLKTKPTQNQTYSTQTEHQYSKLKTEPTQLGWVCSVLVEYVRFWVCSVLKPTQNQTEHPDFGIWWVCLVLSMFGFWVGLVFE